MTITARDPKAPFVLTAPLMPPGRRERGWDRILVAAALALSLLGALLVWAATRQTSGQSYLYRHLINIVIAGALGFGAARLNARLLRLFGPIVYAASIVGLLLVLAVGTTVNGAKAWLSFGGLELQPSEFTKLGLLVGLAVLFTRNDDREPLLRADADPDADADPVPCKADVLRALGLVALPLLLILVEPDLGSALVLGCAVFGVLVAAGVRARWTLGLLVVGATAAVLAVKAGMLDSYQLDRLTTFTHPHQDLQGAAYNVHQARIAIANGGLFGKGLFHGPQTNGGFVPEQQTDFIYSVAGEELGLIGAGLIIVLLGVLCWRGLLVAIAADRTGRLLAVGVVCWFAFQAFQNIGMNLGLTPVTGVPLPFVSYGGSSMFAQGLAVGLLQAVRRHSID